MSLFYSRSHTKTHWQNSRSKSEVLKAINVHLQQNSWEQKTPWSESNQGWEAFIEEKCHFPCCQPPLWMAPSEFPGNNFKYESVKLSPSYGRWPALGPGLCWACDELLGRGINGLQVTRQSNEKNWDKCKQKSAGDIRLLSWSCYQEGRGAGSGDIGQEEVTGGHWVGMTRLLWKVKPC